jgi:23S rRNA (uracil1939-C5)-methyltransferase
MPEELRLLKGVEYLEDQVGPFQLLIHPFTFLQPSTEQAQQLYDCLVPAIQAAPEGVAWDLYCGMGLVAFYLAPKFRWVYGMDSMERNIQLAQLNAARNQIRNVQFRLGNVEDLLKDRRFWLQEARPELVVVDPPRAGLHPRVLTELLAARPKQIAYMSCNVQTLVRDVQQLSFHYPRYRIREHCAFDFFPQTSHVELFVVLERVGPKVVAV